MSRWECSAYSSPGVSFMKKLQELLEDDYENSKINILYCKCMGNMKKT